MNEVGIALAWLAIQVTLIGLFATGVYAFARRLRPAAAPLVVISGLVSVVVLSLLALTGWPRWSFLTSSSGILANMHVAATTEIPEPTGPSGVSPRADARADAAVDHPSRRPVSVEPAGVDRLLPIWQTFLEELSRPPALREPSRRRWPMLISFGFAVAASAALIWLTAGLLAVRGYRRRSRPIKDAEVADQIDRLRTELHCQRPIEIRQTDELVTAATIGWRRPVLLLPPAWREWTEPQRRAVLAHEIAHVRSGDFLSILLGQLGLVLHFYHPLVHWLMGRLRLEQELAADAAAAAVSGGRRAYLTAIAELALAQPHRRMGWPARSFLPTRTTFLRRIAMLRDSKLQNERLSRPARALSVAVVVLFGLFIAGLRGPVANHSALADQAGKTPPAAAEAPESTPSKGGIDLTYVPANAALIMAVRPAEILARPELKEFGILISETDAGRAWALASEDIELKDLAQATLFVPRPASWKDFGPDLSQMYTIILQATGPNDFDQFVGRAFPDVTPVTKGGRTYYRGRVGEDGSAAFAAYFRPDERTLVLGPQRVVAALVGGVSGGVPDFLDAEKWKDFSKGQLFFAADSHAVGALYTSALPEDQRNALGMGIFDPLRKSTSFVLGMGVDDHLRVHGMVHCLDQSATKRVQETLNALVVLGRNAVNQLRAQPAIPGTPQAAQMPWFDMWGRLLENIEIQRQRNTVSLTMSVEMKSLDFLAEAIKPGREAAMRAQSTNNLRQIAIGMHDFHDTYKHFPPTAAGVSKTRQPSKDYPPHSWRVALLPHVDQRQLYEKYHFDEPWDSPANLKLLDQMPAVYRSPKDPPGATDTCYFALVGPGTAFSVEGGTPIRAMRDGTSNSLLIVEAKRSVPWTKPEDIPYDAERPIPELGGYFDGGFHAAFCDGSVRFIANSIDEKMLRALISIAGGELVHTGREQMIPQKIPRKIPSR